LRYLTGLEAGHPVPDERGVAASTEVLAQVNALSDRDVVFVLLSGGGSSLLLAPTEGLTLFDKQATTGALLACGATIQEINCVRKHLSRVKGGQLAKACAPADVLSLVLSDVIGDPLDVIASGPTVPDPTIFADALAILERYGIRDHLPASVVRYVEAGVKGEKPETPKHEDSVFERSHIELVGTNRIALQAAEEEALRRGYTPHILTSTLRGEAREAAKVICALVEGMPYGSGSSALILGGETTVTLSGKSGRGGRNQELALAAARELQGRHDVVLVSLGTDGTDGPTDAAGGLVDGTTWERGQRSGLNLEQALREHDAYPQLKALGDLVVTGPTGTNVMDIVVALVGSGTTV
jgi:hydroxypyruvate reductase